MTALSSTIKELLHQNDMHVTDLAREIGISQQALNKIVLGETAKPHPKTLEAIANFFSITVSDLLQPLPQINVKNIPILPLHQVNDWLKNSTYVKNKQLYTVTNNSISAKSFAIRVEDSTMEPMFPKGTTVIFDPELQPHDRCFVYALINNHEEGSFRQLMIIDNHSFLKPLNPDLSSLIIHKVSETDLILAVLVEAQYKFTVNSLA